jgi:hypothetical protein
MEILLRENGGCRETILTMRRFNTTAPMKHCYNKQGVLKYIYISLITGIYFFPPRIFNGRLAVIVLVKKKEFLHPVKKYG